MKKSAVMELLQPFLSFLLEKNNNNAICYLKIFLVGELFFTK